MLGQGGVPVVAPVKLTDAQVVAHILEVSKIKQPVVHTVYVVEDPKPSTLFFEDRSDIDNICYALPVQHLELYPFSELRLEKENIAFFPFQYHEEALAEAAFRLAKVGRRCAFCHGVVHPATGCQYTKNFILCGRCIRPFQDVMNKVPKEGLATYLEQWTASKSSKKLTARFPNAKGFYESAGQFLGSDNRKVFV